MVFAGRGSIVSYPLDRFLYNLPQRHRVEISGSRRMDADQNNGCFGLKSELAQVYSRNQLNWYR